MIGWIWARTSPGFRLAAEALGDPVRLEEVAPMSELDTRFAGARPGEVISTTQVPPWIVVDRKLAGVLVFWPGRLLEVETLPAMTGEDARHEAATNAEHRGSYQRVTRVRLIREVSPGALFGRQGDAVVDVINRAAALTVEQAGDLATHVDQQTQDAYARVWQRWSGDEHLGDSGVLLDPNIAGGSPVNRGLRVIHDLVDKAAVRHGAARYVSHGDPDDDPPHEDDVWLMLDAPWEDACVALRCAALALGAPDLSGADADALLAPWRSLNW